MTQLDFAAAFPGEGQHVEFKTGIGSEPIQDTAVAFSNADGGVMLIGIRDDGDVAGRELDSGTEDAIHQAIGNARDPGRYGITQVHVDGKPVCVVSVARRRDGFAQTSGGVVKVRRGTRDDPLFGVELVRFANERTASRYETTPLPGVGIKAISPRLRSELAQAMRWEKASVDRLRETELAVGGELTVAGALYLLDDPGRALGKAYVELRRFSDDVTMAYDRREEIRGPLHRVHAGTVARVMEELGTELVVLGVRRYELPRLPEEVLREAIANGLAHRSYETNGTAVRVEMRPSSVVIRSPGGLPEPVTVENMREARAARNRVVIEILRAYGAAEDEGLGVDLMQDAMAGEMLDPPRFADNGHEVTVELPLRSAVAPVERAWIRELEQRGTLRGADRIALVHAARGEILANARVREILGVDEGSARDTLRRLRDEGFLEQRGVRGGATYRLSGSLKPPAGLRLSREELEDVVARLARQGPLTNSDVRAATGLDRAEALALLDRLVRAGRLRRSGERRGTRYDAV
ncbi:MAG TPA: ATP-binding protein [Conexibacter sp.]|nr:ATP-binding protein [Conexibacter sp.]